MIRDLPEHPHPVKNMTHSQTACRPRRQGDKQCDPYIIQTFKGQHPGELPSTHTNGLEHTEFLLAGEKISNQCVRKID